MTSVENNFAGLDNNKKGDLQMVRICEQDILHPTLGFHPYLFVVDGSGNTIGCLSSQTQYHDDGISTKIGVVPGDAALLQPYLDPYLRQLQLDKIPNAQVRPTEKPLDVWVINGERVIPMLGPKLEDPINDVAIDPDDEDIVEGQQFRGSVQDFIRAIGQARSYTVLQEPMKHRNGVLISNELSSQELVITQMNEKFLIFGHFVHGSLQMSKAEYAQFARSLYIAYGKGRDAYSTQPADPQTQGWFLRLVDYVWGLPGADKIQEKIKEIPLADTFFSGENFDEIVAYFASLIEDDEEETTTYPMFESTANEQSLTIEPAFEMEEPIEFTRDGLGITPSGKLLKFDRSGVTHALDGRYLAACRFRGEIVAVQTGGAVLLPTDTKTTRFGEHGGPFSAINDVRATHDRLFMSGTTDWGKTGIIAVSDLRQTTINSVTDFSYARQPGLVQIYPIDQERAFIQTTRGTSLQYIDASYNGIEFSKLRDEKRRLSNAMHLPDGRMGITYNMNQEYTVGLFDPNRLEDNVIVTGFHHGIIPQISVNNGVLCIVATTKTPIKDKSFVLLADYDKVLKRTGKVDYKDLPGSRVIPFNKSAFSSVFSEAGSVTMAPHIYASDGGFRIILGKTVFDMQV